MSERFGDLRAALQEPGDFARVCAAIEEWGEDERELFELALPYAMEHIARWPDTIVRHAPERWLDDNYMGQPPPYLHLANAARYANHTLFDDTMKAPAPTLRAILRRHGDALRSFELAPNLGTAFGEGCWGSVADSRELSQLRHFAYTGWDFDRGRAFERLTHAAFHGSLESLSLSATTWAAGADIGNEELRALLSVRPWPRLERLSLSGFYAHEQFASIPLISLSIRAESFPRVALEPLLRDTLEELSLLEDLGTSSATIRTIERAAPRSLRALKLEQLDQDGLEALLSSPILGRLEVLGLARVRRTNTSPCAMLARAGAHELRELELERCDLTAADLEHLCSSPLAASLERLSICDNPLGATLERVALEALESLEELDVRETRVELDALLDRIEGGALPSLARLGFDAPARSRHRNRLARLGITPLADRTWT